MIFDRIDFHNVSEMLPYENGGWMISRLPEAVRACLTPMGQKHALLASGVELRFRIRSGEADIYFVCGLNDDPKGHAFRQIVREDTVGKLPYVDRLDLLGDSTMLFEGMVHPAQEGHWHIAHRWAEHIKEAGQ